MDIEIKNKEIIGKIKAIELEIASLSEEKRKLVSELNTLPRNNFLLSPYSVESPINEQISLFRSLFRGREDVYARLWTSKKTGKSGYSPVCGNEWSKGICNKPTVKCSDCPNRELSLLIDDVICKHLQGNHTVGIYPLFPDETCCFLAVDFDGEGWQENTFAFKETCFEHNVPAAVERSRSGNGAHVWIFFAENVPAMIARKMGSFLITENLYYYYWLLTYYVRLCS